MRYIIYGAGAIGGVIGARLFQAGHDVTLIARGGHLEAIRRDGLRLRTPDEDVRLPLPAVAHPRELRFGPDYVVFLTMKTQDTEAALHDLDVAGGSGAAVICCQNGVTNERLAARRFDRVYAMLVALPATFLEPGHVDNESRPVSGVLDAGCFPHGTDDLIARVTADLDGAHISSRPDPAVMRLKYTKMLQNLANAIPIVTGEVRGGEDVRRLAERLREEAIACYEAAGIAYASETEYQNEVGARYEHAAIDGRPRGGSSTWQGLARGNTTIEADYLNGEIVLLGRLHGVPTPLNALVRRLATRVAARAEQPGRYTAAGIEALAGAALTW